MYESRKSHGKIGDCEQSNLYTEREQSIYSLSCAGVRYFLMSSAYVTHRMKKAVSPGSAG